MFNLTDGLFALAGLLLIVLVFGDVFQSIVVPHYRPTGIRISPVLTSKVLWAPFRMLIKRLPDEAAQTYLTIFAPAAMMTLLCCWVTVMTLGYACLLWAERSQIKPALNSLSEALYFSAASVLTIGYGDVVAAEAISRLTVICAAVSGIVLLAISVSFLFSVQGHFHTRETMAQVISSRVEHCANGAMFFQLLRKVSSPTGLLEMCEKWIIEVYQSHSAYPLLLYFRSRSSRAAWLVLFGAILDAAAIAITMNRQENRMLMTSIYENGSRALAVFAVYLGRSPEPDEAIQDASRYEEMFRALGAKEPDQAAVTFTSLRARYYPELCALSDFFLIAVPSIGLIDMERLSDNFEATSVNRKHIPTPGMTSFFNLPAQK